MDPAGWDTPRVAGETPGGHSFAPTEFPKRRSAVGHPGPEDLPCHTACAPQVEEHRRQINARRRVLASALPPKDLSRTVASGQPSTDPTRCPLPPARGSSRDFGPSPRASPERLLVEGLTWLLRVREEVRPARRGRADQSERGQPPLRSGGSREDTGGETTTFVPSLYIRGRLLSRKVAQWSTGIGKSFFEVDFVWQNEKT